MGTAFEVIHGRVVNPGVGLPVATAPATGDSFAVRSFNFDAGANLENLWAMAATGGVVRVRSPRMADNVQGLRLGNLAATPQPLLPYEIDERLYPQDVLALEMNGGAAETDVMALLLYYQDLPGVAARLAMWEEIKPRVKNILTVETTHATGATLGDYGGGVALNSSFDLLKANVDYALLGYLTSVPVCSVGYRSSDTGNLRVGGPGTTQRVETRDWFVELSRAEGRPHIPILNAANKQSTIVDLVHTAAATAVVVQSILAELG
jgi:hypothetical protein